MSSRSWARNFCSAIQRALRRCASFRTGAKGKITLDMEDGSSREVGITRLGGFMALPREAIRKRFGPDAEALHEMAADGVVMSTAADYHQA